MQYNFEQKFKKNTLDWHKKIIGGSFYFQRNVNIKKFKQVNIDILLAENKTHSHSRLSGAAL